ncbi:hypothetical protein E2C01_058135 [Portunus trituberculatus]|uniref:HTH psq-type domain-containing protein n=1 Tax=Portunus trituberculatus TaxID=210409 RepID=A0A5B7H2Y0_PORTR|nr:hypothetical protein [Portunus trituberculatus]
MNIAEVYDECQDIYGHYQESSPAWGHLRSPVQKGTLRQKGPPYHASQQAFEYTSASRGQHAHHSLPLLKIITASAAVRLPSLNLPPKRPAIPPSVAKKTRKSLTLQVKLDIIHRHEARKPIALLATILTPSTVSTIFKSALY